MNYWVSLTAVQRIGYEKPCPEVDTSVKDYLESLKSEREKKERAKARLLVIIKNPDRTTVRKFGSHYEAIRILSLILEEICLEEMELALSRFQKLGVRRCITFLLQCAE